MQMLTFCSTTDHGNCALTKKTASKIKSSALVLRLMRSSRSSKPDSKEMLTTKTTVSLEVRCDSSTSLTRKQTMLR